MFAPVIPAVFLAGFIASASLTDAQPLAPAPDAVRVTVAMNADGSRTVYKFDSLNHKAKATTTDRNGKPVGTIRYVLDKTGHFIRGEVYGPDDQLRLKTLYKYDDAGRLNQETQFSKDDAVQHKLIYAYDKIGRQTGYAVYDATGKLVSHKGPSPTSTPTNKRR